MDGLVVQPSTTSRSDRQRRRVEQLRQLDGRTRSDDDPAGAAAAAAAAWPTTQRDDVQRPTEAARHVVEASRRPHDAVGDRRLRRVVDALLRRQPRPHLHRLPLPPRRPAVDLRAHHARPLGAQPAALRPVQSARPATVVRRMVRPAATAAPPVLLSSLVFLLLLLLAGGTVGRRRVAGGSSDRSRQVSGGRRLFE